MCKDEFVIVYIINRYHIGFFTIVTTNATHDIFF